MLLSGTSLGAEPVFLSCAFDEFPMQRTERKEEICAGGIHFRTKFSSLRWVTACPNPQDVIKSECLNRLVTLQQIESFLGVKDILLMQWQVFGQSCHHITRVSIEVELSRSLSWENILLQIQEIRNWFVKSFLPSLVK
jgi:hypothetical protein